MTKAEVIVQAAQVDLAGHGSVFDDGLDLRGKHHPPLVQVVVEGLDADAIARAKQLLLALVPDRKREHAIEPLDAVLAILLVGMDDDFTVCMGPEDVAAALERFSQLAEIIDLAVIGQPDALILVGHRLMPMWR